ncbi:hypothetical protein V494_01377 [Pseudogymnoascus sp. VKM F-4513 (FW-928)]|nr:hypothetical protein V494_01377 [Pseudogymnoascus sp. VKM F-4513 (FW-928)]
MATSYLDAIDIIQSLAVQNSTNFAADGLSIPVKEAVGRVCKDNYYSLFSTPSADTSAMDGYAVNSESTRGASISSPVILCVKGTMAAGDAPLELSSGWEDGFLLCTEIMTGAQFPASTSDMQFDACVRIEDTTPVCGRTSTKYVQIVKPVCKNQNRRFAGTDFRKKDLIIPAGSAIRPHHVMAFASLGINEVAVYQRPRIAVLSTGSELIDLGSHEKDNHIHDSNGPYISAVLQEMGADVTNLGIIKDDYVEFENLMLELCDASYDVIITTGAVSKGKYDFIRRVIEAIGAKVLFHKVAIRPGHPVLFATLPSRNKKEGDGSVLPGLQSTAFFGLPGNPLAAASCFRFLVIPYLRSLHRQLPEKALPARLDTMVTKIKRPEGPYASSQTTLKPSYLHVFWHGKLRFGLDGIKVHISSDQGSGKVRPLLASNCWISVPQGKGSLDGDEVIDTFPLYPDSLGSYITEEVNNLP